MRRRLSFKDRHALDTLPARIAALEAEIVERQALLADADLYRRDPAAFTRAGETLARAQSALRDAEERWLELEMLAEGA